ncbi:MAG: phosphoribosylaminoimidazolesuccinocarboxamide synthase [Proteobacteria bacterium]|nr:phosphoribosylaminoimidazolesuccinocarboxamide synthase [Pseudomonadota bacterium]
MNKIPSPLHLSELYEVLERSLDDDGLWQKNIWEGPTASDIAKWQGQGYGVYQGKIRTVLSRDGRIQMLHSDRLTAFDRLISHVPGKGALLTAISRWWFEQISKEVPTHYLESPGPRVIVTEACVPIKAEVVVRGYLAGSMLRAYEKGVRVYCGVPLPDGLNAYQRLIEPILTPTTKAGAFEHDENVTAEALVSSGVCNQETWDEITKIALKVYSLGTRLSSERGWILADTKYEFGKSPTGEIKLIDEVHTPDSSRLWIQDTYDSRLASFQPPEMIDKENVRRWLLEQGFSGEGAVPLVPRAALLQLGRTYLNVAESLTMGPVLI